jgi:hypothetical protein
MRTSSFAVDESDTVLAHAVAACVVERLAALAVDVVPLITGKIEINTALMTIFEIVTRFRREDRFIEKTPSAPIPLN